VLRRQKEKIINEIRDQIHDSHLVILTTFTGLNVEKITKLRKSLREVESNYRVVKNTLITKAIKDTDLESLEKFFTGSSAVIFAKGDPSRPCKVLKEFKKDHEQLEIKGGMFEGRMLLKKDIEGLADLPSREVLLAQFLFLLRAPQQRLVTVLIGVPQKLVRVLEAIKQKKESQQ
jgi:large subunit ribosomal protein L10